MLRVDYKIDEIANKTWFLKYYMNRHAAGLTFY